MLKWSTFAFHITQPSRNSPFSASFVCVRVELAAAIRMWGFGWFSGICSGGRTVFPADGSSLYSVPGDVQYSVGDPAIVGDEDGLIIAINYTITKEY